ncbi:MAG: FHA domain-containing protein [Castellaniella sp.]|uniref:ATPase, T2SS/T4P/T4SS family n=1 Tax=Castellaniella sp. TaxID=1955812 RepID=UPI0012268F7F|nr:ATPase, T2SS/T4P/T4SS family [Castellaniella sp.]TAN30720.1 MAG: FHA domain-containing protein [Castellaniella sp.]
MIREATPQRSSSPACVELALAFEDGRQRRAHHELPLLIGRDASCGLPLRSWRVARHHARLGWRQDGVWVEDLGALTGTSVNGQRVASYGPLRPHDELVIGPCLVRVLSADLLLEREAAEPVAAAAVGPRAPGPVSDVIPWVVHEPGLPVAGVPPPAWNAHRRRLHDGLIAALQLRRQDIGHMSDAALRAEASVVLQQLIAAEPGLDGVSDPAALVADLVNEAVGLGPLEPLLEDPGVTEIMVNRHDEIFVERAGRLAPAGTTFSSEQAVLGVIDRIVAPLGRRIDDGAPMVDARLPDGSRVNAVIAPIALRGASLTIRKFPAKRLNLGDLLKTGALDRPMAQFLTHCVQHRRNLVVSGGTGSGKTSLLNVLSNAIPSGERIITIEDAAELRLNHAHLVSLEARPANLEGRGRVEIRDLVRNALRMRPDRIVVGECRGGEAFDMLAAMNTGHEGSLTTLHANSPRDALSRLETMILMAGMDLPLQAVREHIAASVDFIVQLVRVADGRRMVSAIVEVTGLEGGRIQMQELFVGESGPPAVFTGCGLLPGGFSGAAVPDMAWFVQRTVSEGQAALPAEAEDGTCG